MNVSSDARMKMSPAMRSQATKMPRASNGQRGLVCAGIALCVLALVALVWPQPRAELPAVSAPKSATTASAALTGDKAVAQLQKNGQYHSLIQAVEQSRYAVTPIERDRRATGEFFASNPSQKFSARFDNGGVQISPAGDKANAAKDALQVLAASKALGPQWKWNLKLRAYGYGDAWQAAGAAQPLANSVGSGDARKFSYRRGAVTEWFVNAQNGLEQGFTLQQPPQQKSGNQPLRVALAVSSDLTAREIKSEKNGGVAFADKSGATVLTYRKLRAWDANKRDLPSRMNLERGANGRAEIVLAVADAGAAYPITIDPLIATEEAKLTASDGAANDKFGFSVALDDDTALVYAAADQEGFAYVFVRSGNNWTQQAKLTPRDAAYNRYFGYSVALSGNTALVSTTQSVFVFVRSGSNWTQQQKLIASDSIENQSFANSVAIEGDTALIGANNSAYVFVRSNGDWAQQAKLTAADGSANQGFGGKVAISGDTALVGALSDERAGGSAYVFVRNGGNWTQQQKLTASDSVQGDRFGWSVAVSGDTVLIGGQKPGNAATGYNLWAVYVFVRSGSNWTQQQKLTDGVTGSAYFGYSVAISGDTALIGAPQQATPNQPTGAAYVFVRNAGNWSQQDEFIASDTTIGDFFGGSVALSGNTVLIGAHYKDNAAGNDAGSAYVFRLVPNTAPTISDISNQTTLETTPLTVNFTVGDSETPPANLVVTATSSDATIVPDNNISLGGTGANRTLTITPSQNVGSLTVSATTTITVTVSDKFVTTSDSFVFTVNAINRVPYADTQFLNTDNTTPLSITLTGDDANNDALTFTIVRGPQNGTLSGAPPNLIYTANPGFRGGDDFEVTASDGQATSGVAIIHITVSGDPAVTAADDAYNLILGSATQAQQAGVVLQANGIFVIAAPGVLANDKFSAGSKLQVRATSSPKNGRFLLRDDGTLFYLPSTGRVGLDELTYILSDGKTSATAKVRLNIVDRREPELRLDVPADRATTANVTKIAGRVRDRNAGLKTLTLLWQRFDGKFWNGRSWSSAATELPLTVQGINWIYAGTLPKPGSNATTDLLDGRYDLRVTATDNSGNIARLTNRITVSTPPIISSVRLSSAAATTNSIVLNFTGALDAAAASKTSNFAVSVNGKNVAIGTATYANNVVTLSGFSFAAGDAIELQISDLLDATGKTFKGGKIQLIAR